MNINIQVSQIKRQYQTKSEPYQKRVAILESESDLKIVPRIENEIFYPNRRKTPSFSYGDIRQVCFNSS